MKQTSTSGMGALHPIMFFFLVYGISLFLALFVCRTVYYSINEPQEMAAIQPATTTHTAAVAYR